MNHDKGDAQRSTDRSTSTLGEGIQRLELDYPDELAYEEHPLMWMEHPLMGVESPLVGNPLMRVENPLMGMKRFGYEGFED